MFYYHNEHERSFVSFSRVVSLLSVEQGLCKQGLRHWPTWVFQNRGRVRANYQYLSSAVWSLVQSQYITGRKWGEDATRMKQRSWEKASMKRKNLHIISGNSYDIAKVNVAEDLGFL